MGISQEHTMKSVSDIAMKNILAFPNCSPTLAQENLPSDVDEVEEATATVLHHFDPAVKQHLPDVCEESRSSSRLAR